MAKAGDAHPKFPLRRLPLLPQRCDRDAVQTAALDGLLQQTQGAHSGGSDGQAAAHHWLHRVRGIGGTQAKRSRHVLAPDGPSEASWTRMRIPGGHKGRGALPRHVTRSRTTFHAAIPAAALPLAGPPGIPSGTSAIAIGMGERRTTLGPASAAVAAGTRAGGSARDRHPADRCRRCAMDGHARDLLAVQVGDGQCDRPHA